MYHYDENGNQRFKTLGENALVRRLEYTHYDKPYLVKQSSNESRYRYDAQRNKLERESRINSGVNQRTWYLPGIEIVIDSPLAPPGQQIYRYRRQIDGVAQVTETGGNTTETVYYHYDHLNSLVGISLETTQTQHLSYDAFGRRRQASDWNTLESPIHIDQALQHTDHGYGDHENRDELGMIHMGGRTYDPALGQMMQADAVVQSPLNGQNYNRYAYVFNNPMSYTDPTGFVSEFASRHFSSLSRGTFSSQFGAVRGGLSQEREKALEMERQKGDMAAFNPGVAVNSLVNLLPGIAYLETGLNNSLSRFNSENRDGFSLERQKVPPVVDAGSSRRGLFSGQEADVLNVAAFELGDLANIRSSRRHSEFGAIGFTDAKGDLQVTSLVRGQSGKVKESDFKDDLSTIRGQVGTNIVFVFHNHGNDSAHFNKFEGFSYFEEFKQFGPGSSKVKGDINFLTSSREIGKPVIGFLATPRGKLLRFDPQLDATGTVVGGNVTHVGNIRPVKLR